MRAGEMTNKLIIGGLGSSNLGGSWIFSDLCQLSCLNSLVICCFFLSFYQSLGCSMANFWPMTRGQTHSLDDNHCFYFEFNPEVPRSLLMKFRYCFCHCIVYFNIKSFGSISKVIKF